MPLDQTALQGQQVWGSTGLYRNYSLDMGLNSALLPLHYSGLTSLFILPASIIHGGYRE